MAFKNSLKLYLEKGFFSFAGRRLASGPPAEAGPASLPQRRAPRLGPAQPRAVPARPASARWPLLPRAAPFTVPRSRPRQATPAAWPPCAGNARRAAATACGRSHAPAYICCPRCAPHFALPLSQAQQQQQRAPVLPSSPTRSAGVELPHHRAIPRFLPPATPPRPSSSRAHACAAFRTRVEPPRASPTTAMAPPCSAAMEVVFLLFSSLA